MAQEPQAVGPGVGGVGIREVSADVPQSGGPQEGVHEGVGGHVGIRMPQQAEGVGDVYPA